MRGQRVSLERRSRRSPAEAPNERASTREPSLAGQVLQLQRTAGNQAVCQLLAAGQAKLKVGSSHDPLEHEADEIARRVVASLQTGGPALDSDTSADRPGVRRRAPIGEDGGSVDVETEALIDTSSGKGRPMEAGVRRRFEDAFGGADFSAVRLHAGADAAELNDRLSAQAFTLEDDVFLGRGAPALDTREGQELMAHELTHTIQQSDGHAARRVRRTPDGAQIQRLRSRKNERSSSPPKVPKGDRLEFEGVVEEALPKGMFRVRGDNGLSVLATTSGGMRQRYEKVEPGDRVTLAVSPYDPTRGEITRGHK